MNPCSGPTDRIHRYLDAELPAHEAIEFEKHLVECPECRAAYQDLRSVSDLVRGARPIYVPPESSYRSARELVARAESRKFPVRWLFAGAAAAAAGAAVLLLWRPPDPSFPDFASAAHQRLGGHASQLGVAANDPRIVSAWLEPRLGFHLRLPDYPGGKGAKPYRLAGASVVDYRRAKSALIAYEMDGKPITLLMTASAEAAPTGGQLYRSGKLVFHFYERGGLRIIIWTDRSTHYALVAELGASGAESCTVCHGAPSERYLIEELAPNRRN